MGEECPQKDPSRAKSPPSEPRPTPTATLSQHVFPDGPLLLGSSLQGLPVHATSDEGVSLKGHLAEGHAPKGRPSSARLSKGRLSEEHLSKGHLPSARLSEDHPSKGRPPKRRPSRKLPPREGRPIPGCPASPRRTVTPLGWAGSCRSKPGSPLCDRRGLAGSCPSSRPHYACLGPKGPQSSWGTDPPNIFEDPSSISVSFAGCGFLGIYHVGVAACLRRYAPHLLGRRLAGASAGALAAALLLCNADLGVITSSVLKTATEARARALGPFSPTFDVERLLRDGLLTVLPANAHEIVNGRLFVSVTRVSDGRNVLLSHFASREELVQALLCSAFIPAFSGYRPLRIRGVRYADGGFSDNLPELDGATVTVSPFCGEADVCPKDSTAGIITVSLANTSIEVSRENLQRFARILFPPPPETLSRMCQQGFNDALDFLQRNNLIACTRCVAVQSTLPLAHDAPHPTKRPATPTYPPWQEEWETCADCPDCRQQRQEAVLDELPQQVVAILQEAIEAANAEVHRWWGLSPPRKLASLLAWPAAAATRMWTRLQDPSLGLRGFLSQLSELVRGAVLSRRHAAVQSLHDAAHHHHRAPLHAAHAPGADNLTPSFSCNLAITEYSGSGERRESTRTPHLEVWRCYDSDVSEEAYDSESEALRHIAQQYAERSSRRSSLVPQLASHGPSRPPSRVPSRPQSRAVSRAVSRRTSVSEGCPPWAGAAPGEDQPPDTLDRILTVTGEQEALMAYYYLDEHNQMQVTEIFDMSAADDALPAPPGGRASVSGGLLAPPAPGSPAWTASQRPAMGILKKGLAGSGGTLAGGDPQQEDYIYSQLTKFWESCDSVDGAEGSVASTGSPPSEPEADQHLLVPQ